MSGNSVLNSAKYSINNIYLINMSDFGKYDAILLCQNIILALFHDII